MPTKIPQHVIDATVRMYASGLSEGDVAARTGVTVDAVRRRLVRAGVSLRPRQPRRDELDCLGCNTRLRWKVPSGMCGFCEHDHAAGLGNKPTSGTAAFPNGGAGV